jgi:hypothetical protein
VCVAGIEIFMRFFFNDFFQRFFFNDSFSGTAFFAITFTAAPCAEGTSDRANRRAKKALKKKLQKKLQKKVEKITNYSITF